MTILPTGDLARHIIMRQQMAATKSSLQRHSTEMTTGRAADAGQRLKGDFTALAGIERNLTKLQAFRNAATDVSLFASSLQRVLETVQNYGRGAAEHLLSVVSTGDHATLDAAMLTARDYLSAAVSAVNGKVSDRSLMSGADTASSALLSSDAILAALRDATAGATTAEQIETITRDWFNAGNAYVGAAESVAPIAIFENESVSLDVRGDDPAVSETLIGLALGVLMDHPGLSDQLRQRADLAQRAGETLMAAQSPLIALRAQVGLVEARVDAVLARVGAEKNALIEAREAQIGVNQFDAATELATAQLHLETLYTVTARLSRLSLADFLR